MSIDHPDVRQLRIGFVRAVTRSTPFWAPTHLDAPSTIHAVRHAAERRSHRFEFDGAGAFRVSIIRRIRHREPGPVFNIDGFISPSGTGAVIWGRIGPRSFAVFLTVVSVVIGGPPMVLLLLAMIYAVAVGDLTPAGVAFPVAFALVFLACIASWVRSRVRDSDEACEILETALGTLLRTGASAPTGPDAAGHATSPRIGPTAAHPEWGPNPPGFR